MWALQLTDKKPIYDTLVCQKTWRRIKYNTVIIKKSSKQHHIASSNFICLSCYPETNRHSKLRMEWIYEERNENPLIKIRRLVKRLLNEIWKGIHKMFIGHIRSTGFQRESSNEAIIWMTAIKSNGVLHEMWLNNEWILLLWETIISIIKWRLIKTLW